MIANQQVLTSLVTDNYLRALYAMAKTTNGLPFRGFAPGEVFYVGPETNQVTNTINDFDWQVTNITHQFIIEPNLVGFWFDGVIPVDRKLGHEYLWASAIRTDRGVEATQVNVAPVYGVSDLNLLGLG